MNALTRPLWRSVSMCALVGSCVVLAACGGSDSSKSSSSTTTGGGGSDSVAATDKIVDQLYNANYAPWGKFTDIEKSVKPIAGKKIWFMSPGQNTSYGAIESKNAELAGKMLGWDVTVFDTKGDTNTELNGIRQAIASKADGIAVAQLDCAPVKAALTEAKKAGIKIVANEAADCDADGGPKLFDYTTNYNPGGVSFLKYLFNYSQAQAAWIVSATEGKGKIINVRELDVSAGVAQDDGFRHQIAKCSGCEILENVTIVLTDYNGSSIQQKVSAALLQHPDADSMVVPADAVITSGVAAALRQSGRLGKIKVMGAEGQPENISFILNGKGEQDAGVGLSTAWETFAQFDGLNRLFNNAPLAKSSGIGLAVYDKEHTQYIKTGTFIPPIDFVTGYEKAWGLK